jgi:hypothetical protein
MIHANVPESRRVLQTLLLGKLTLTPQGFALPR